jgi:ribonuclease-3
MKKKSRTKTARKPKARKNPYAALEKSLGYRFKRAKRLESALTHRSFRFEIDPGLTDNQRLEFLGDAALGLVAAHYLYDTFPEFQEGGLTKLRSSIASTRALATFAARVHVGSYLRLGKGEQMSGGMERTSNLTDAMEAILGAAFLDGGIKAVEKIFKKLFVPYLKKTSITTLSDNPKGDLQEWAQKTYHSSPFYRLLSEEGPPHARIFRVEVIVAGRVMGAGEGNSKRAAETEAAIMALATLPPNGNGVADEVE